MRNNRKTQIQGIMELGEKLPYFEFPDLSPLETNKTYLKILFSRYEKAGRLIRLKKGMYVTKTFLDELEKRNRLSPYLEFVANTLSRPSYLSLEYVLYQENLLTEIPVHFTSITRNKTARFKNKLGTFLYHSVKDTLFCGFQALRENNFLLFRATKAKALFDFLYLRKNILEDKKSVEELRLNLDILTESDTRELKQYVELEGSQKMKKIFAHLTSLCVWYLERGVKPTLSCIKGVSSQEELKRKLEEIVERVDERSIQLDLEALIGNEAFVENISKNLKDILQRDIQTKL